jgi:DNA-directed RNA polymerase
MDATQSGGQHFCGASLNYNDAVLTNIVPQDKPNDLYLACLAEARRLLVEKLEEDKATAEADPITPEDQQVIDAFNAFQNDESKTFDELKDNRAEFKQTIAYARLKVLRHIDACERTLAWEGYDRTVMKRNAMTYFYSSRRYGFAEQIRKDTMKELSKKVRLKELKEHPFGKDRGYTASHVLGAIHEQAIENVVESAAQGMAFFRSCADALSRENKQFSFVTRWGAPVRQWYETVAEHPNRPSCWLHSFRTIPRTKKRDEVPAGEIDRACESLSLTKYTGRVDSRKARNAIAPNIIHAQDALLLQMAVLLCAEEGVTDVMVIHDSFATTIANAGVMSQCLRLAFVDLYEDYNLYEDIRDQVLAQLDNPDEAELAPMPKRGDLDLRVILGSDYAFS